MNDSVRPQFKDFKLVRVLGREVAVSVSGEPDGRPPLLMFNGVGAQVKMWGRFRELVGRPTITMEVEARHLGLRPSLRTYAGFVSRVLDELQEPEVDLIGFSWGGMAAQEFTRRNPDRVRRLVLNATTPGFISQPGRPAALNTLLSPNRSPKKALAGAATFYGGDIKDNPHLLFELGLVRHIDADVYRRQLAACLGWTSVPWLGRLSQRTLIIAGSDDPVIPVANAHLMHRLIRGSRLEVVPNGGHLFILTRPVEIAQLVTDFLVE